MTATILPFPPAGARPAHRRGGRPDRNTTTTRVPGARFPGARTRGADWATDAHDILDEVEELLARGHVADVLAFCDRAVAVLERNARDIVDPAPLVRLARRVGDLERQARARSPSPGGAR